jgi:uncharacterized membrane protein required for colicin V production
MKVEWRYLGGALLALIMFVLAHLFLKTVGPSSATNFAKGVLVFLFLVCICKAFNVKIGVWGE